MYRSGDAAGNYLEQGTPERAAAAVACSTSADGATSPAIAPLAGQNACGEGTSAWASARDRPLSRCTD